ncbi:hypothetical protein HAT2_00279 [Candidatus Similichlamydia laticola]|uniref:Uncharacterized protein n=2 Tax=Candidatus Similichlamydia laticola TaxID=2170265 RepID=A0A369KIL9_9BACT|nr:hypothetical protein HAT2_00279 [Candidatus Similichlamydia laticola]
MSLPTQYPFHRSLMKNCGPGLSTTFLPSYRSSRILLGSLAKTYARPTSTTGYLRGLSVFILASDREEVVALLCQKGDLELKGIDPMNPYAGCFDLETLLGTEPDETSSEEEPCTSAKALEYDKKLSSQEENFFSLYQPKGQKKEPLTTPTTQKSPTPSNPQRESERRMAAALALIELSKYNAPQDGSI